MADEQQQQQRPIQIIDLPIDQIVPWDKNPRLNFGAVDAVAASIADFGMNVPIIVNSQNIVIAGHTRLLACKKLGYTSIPAVVIDHLTEEQQAAFNIADNKTASLAAWDDEKLRTIFEDLKLSDYDLSKTGFQTAEIDAIMSGWQSDIQAIEATQSSSEAAPGKIAITCRAADVEEIRAFLKDQVRGWPYEGVKIE